MLSKLILLIAFLNKADHFFFFAQLNNYKYCYKTVTILHQSNFSTHSLFYLTHGYDPFRVDLKVKAMNGYSTFPRYTSPESSHQIV